MRTIGERIKKFRKMKGLTQNELAVILGGDYNAKRISNWERDLASPQANVIPILAKALDCTPNDLLGSFKPKVILDPDNIIERYYNLPDKSKDFVDLVIEHEKSFYDEIKKYNDIPDDDVDDDDFLIAAHGSEGMDDDELEIVKQDAQHLKDLFDNDKV